jgi:CheY-like chemotaxis protein
MSDHASGRVLLVDTDEQSAQQAREWIERSFHGVTVTVARSFQQAVAEVQEDVRAAAKEGAGASATNDVAGHLTPPSSPGIRKPHHYFDVVLLDYSLVSEEENKIAELQRYGKSHILPIVAMVTSVQPAVIAHLVSHGAHDFVLKPLHRLLLLSRVHAVISGNRVERMRNAHATLMAIRDAKIAQLQEQARKWHKKAMKYNRQLNASSLPE